jgi:hypothetical protein
MKLKEILPIVNDNLCVNIFTKYEKKSIVLDVIDNREPLNAYLDCEISQVYSEADSELEGFSSIIINVKLND